MTYELINMTTMNSVSSFKNERKAWLAYSIMCSTTKDAFALVSFDDNGEAKEKISES